MLTSLMTIAKTKLIQQKLNKQDDIFMQLKARVMWLYLIVKA
jgi:hypothetical protein